MGVLPTTAWDESVPKGTDNVSQGDNEIRTMKTQMREALARIMDFPSSGQATCQLKVPQVAESALGGISDQVNEMLAVSNDTYSLFARISGAFELIGSPGLLKDTRANQPVAGYAGRLYWVSDEGMIERDTGSAWELVMFANDLPDGRSVVYHDHFADSGIAISGSGASSVVVSSMWEVSYEGDADNMTSGWEPSTAYSNGVIHGFGDPTENAIIESRATIAELAKNPLVLCRFRFVDSPDDGEMRWGLADDWTNVTEGTDPTKGIFIRRDYETAVDDDFYGVVVDTGGTTTVDLGSADALWHDLKIVCTGGNKAEFILDGTSKGSVSGISGLTEKLVWGGACFGNGGSAAVELFWDYVTIICDGL